MLVRRGASFCDAFSSKFPSTNFYIASCSMTFFSPGLQDVVCDVGGVFLLADFSGFARQQRKLSSMSHGGLIAAVFPET